MDVSDEDVDAFVNMLREATRGIPAAGHPPAMLDERAEIVTWLRDQCPERNPGIPRHISPQQLASLADAVERGAHLQGQGGYRYEERV